MLVKFLSLVALGAASAMAAATTTTTALEPFNPPLPDPSTLTSRSTRRTFTQIEDRELTNAKRLAAGLPLKRPVRRNHRGGNGHGGNPHHPQPSGHPGGGNGGCTSGHLEVRDNDGNCIGYVGKDWNDYGQYGLCGQDDIDLRLEVSIDLELAKRGATDIKTVNGPDADFPYFGGITGFTSDCGCSDISQNSKNYVYLGATTQTDPHAPPQSGSNSFTKKTQVSRKVQSAIFSYDSDTSEITPQWINEDSSTPPTHLGISHSSLILAGDQDLFSKIFGADDTQWISIHFVPKN